MGAMFRSMFGDKPVSQIVEEVEQALSQQEAQMQAQETALREQAKSLRYEANELQMAAGRERNPVKRAKLLARATAKVMEADRTEQAQQAMGFQHMVQRL